MIQYGHGSHVGRRRQHNEDTYLADAALGLWLVADGMGGHAHGEVASAMARDAIRASVESGQLLDVAIRAAADRINQQSRGGGENGLPMGTTVAVVRADELEFHAAWVGDSRIYLWNGSLQQISQDHSYVQHLVQQGTLTPGEARRHPQRNVVTQALGVTDRDALEIATVSQPWSNDAQLLLCSDGLTEEVDDAEIATVFERGYAPQETADHLIHAALKAGGSDNITVIVLKRCT